jgi:hypothetical protein
MRRLLMYAGLLLIIGSACVLVSVTMLAARPTPLLKEMRDYHDQWMAANWLFAAGLLLTIPRLCLRQASRREGSPSARSWSTAAHAVFFTGCMLGLTLAALRLGFGGIGGAEIGGSLLRMVWSTNNALCVGVFVVFGLGFVLDAVFLWSDDGFGPAAAMSIFAGLGLIGWAVIDAVIDAGTAPWPPFAVLVVLGFSLLGRALDDSSTGALTAPGRRPPPGGTPE